MCKNDDQRLKDMQADRSADVGLVTEALFKQIFQDDALEKSVKKDQSNGAFRGKKPFRL